MRSKLRRLSSLPLSLALLICLPLLSTGCVSASTKASRARIERPVLPTVPADLVARERLKPLTGDASGARVSIDRGVLAELYTRLAEAIGAVERGNLRAAGVERWAGCVDTIWQTGAAPDDRCEAP